MNGTELRSFSHFQILTKIAHPDLSRKLENWLFLEFFFIHCKTVKVSQNDQIQMQTWFTSGFLMNGTLRWIIAGGKYFMHMGTLLVTLDVSVPNLIGWISEHQCIGVVRELWDVDFLFFNMAASCAWFMCLVQANRVPVQDEIVRMNPNVSNLDS